MTKRHKQEEAPDAPVETPHETTPVATAPKAETPKATLAEKRATFDSMMSKKGITLTSKEFNSLGLKVTIPVPTSVEDFDTLAGEQGAALREGIGNIVYRGPLAVFRNELCDRVEAITKIARKFTITKNDDGTDKLDSDGTPVVEKWEAEAVYIKRVAGDNPEQFQSIANEISSSLTFDPSKPEPKSAGPKSIAKVYLKTAQDLFDQGRGEKVIAALSAKLGIAAPVTVEGLASLVKEDQRRKQAALVSEYAATAE